MDFHFLSVRLSDGIAARPWNGDDEKGARTMDSYRPKIISKTSPFTGGPARAHRNGISGRTDSYHGKNGFRLKFVHANNDCIYIQKDSDSPRLVVGVFE